MDVMPKNNGETNHAIDTPLPVAGEEEEGKSYGQAPPKGAKQGVGRKPHPPSFLPFSLVGCL